VRGLGIILRPLQSGYVRSYAFVMLVGAFLVLVAMLFYSQ